MEERRKRGILVKHRNTGGTMEHWPNNQNTADFLKNGTTKQQQKKLPIQKNDILSR